MSKKHISVIRAMLVWAIGAILILIGLVSLFSGNTSTITTGLGLMIFGFIVVALNKLVFRVRTTQLNIDTKEGIRDQIGNVCPNCGTRNPQGAKFCNKCGYKLQ